MKIFTTIGIFLIIGITIALLVFSRQNSPVVTNKQSMGDTIRYLPLGDSYTIGQSVPEDMRWSNILSSKYAAVGKPLDIVDNPARTGYTTQDLIQFELPLVEKYKPDMVSVLIGVNDYVQGVDENTFESQLKSILDFLQTKKYLGNNIFLVTIPDFGKTPAGRSFGDPAESEQAMRRFNEIIINEARTRNLPVTDIFAISQQAAQDASLIASDGLHPSGLQYQRWADEAFSVLQSNDFPKILR